MSFLYSLCSSSKGNCTYVGSRESGILIDAGIGIRNFSAHLSMIGLKSNAIKGILITHEHGDHIKGLARIQAALNVPVYASEGTLGVLLDKGAVNPNMQMHVLSGEKMEIADLQVHAFQTPHDCMDGQGYCIAFPDGKRVAVCTDLGYVTKEIHNQLLHNDLVLLESNYEEALLKIGMYPPFLKRRIAGDLGHLSNEDCSNEICSLFDSGIKKFVLGHLSEENNRPDLAYINVVTELAKKGAQPDRDFSLHVAPKTNIGKIIEV